MCNYAQETASIHTKDQFTPKKTDAPPMVAPFGRAIRSRHSWLEHDLFEKPLTHRIKSDGMHGSCSN
jgi:hypothetical protein